LHGWGSSWGGRVHREEGGGKGGSHNYSFF
jgi:hypothetical protein